jgi:peptidoglycan-associated lipoprotein
MHKARLCRWGLIAAAALGGYAILAVCYAQADRVLAMTDSTTDTLYADMSSGPQLAPNIGDRVFFDVDQSSLTPRARRRLLEWVVYLKSYPSDRMTIEGHTDARGTPAYNLALGERRADAVRDFLLDHDIEAARLTAVSFGDTRPVVAGSGDKVWAQNRRVVGIVIHTDQQPNPASGPASAPAPAG